MACVAAVVARPEPGLAVAAPDDDLLPGRVEVAHAGLRARVRQDEAQHGVLPDLVDRAVDLRGDAGHRVRARDGAGRRHGDRGRDRGGPGDRVGLQLDAAVAGVAAGCSARWAGAALLTAAGRVGRPPPCAARRAGSAEWLVTRQCLSGRVLRRAGDRHAVGCPPGAAWRCRPRRVVRPARKPPRSRGDPRHHRPSPATACCGFASAARVVRADSSGVRRRADRPDQGQRQRENGGRRNATPSPVDGGGQRPDRLPHITQGTSSTTPVEKGTCPDGCNPPNSTPCCARCSRRSGPAGASSEFDEFCRPAA